MNLSEVATIGKKTTAAYISFKFLFRTGASSHEMSAQSLPQEIILSILQYVDPEDPFSSFGVTLQAVCETCRSWRAAGRAYIPMVSRVLDCRGRHAIGWEIIVRWFELVRHSTR